MKKNGILIIGAIVIFLIAVFAWKVALQPSDSEQQQNVAGDQIDIVLDFYGAWLDSRKAQNDTPFKPLEFEYLSQELKDQLKDFDFTSSNKELDPVLCQTTVPPGFRSRIISEGAEKTEILILSSEKGVSEQAVVTLEARDGVWQIADIVCGAGEQAPELGEYSFDEKGHLLKDSLPNVFDKSQWHIVFTVDDVPGHTAVLMFSATSMCIMTNGTTGVCDLGTFSEASAVHVQGQLTEAGVTVERVEFVAE